MISTPMMCYAMLYTYQSWYLVSLWSHSESQTLECPWKRRPLWRLNRQTVAIHTCILSKYSQKYIISYMNTANSVLKSKTLSLMAPYPPRMVGQTTVSEHVPTMGRGVGTSNSGMALSIRSHFNIIRSTTTGISTSARVFSSPDGIPHTAVQYTSIHVLGDMKQDCSTHNGDKPSHLCHHV